MKNEKGKSLAVILIIVLVVLAGGWFFYKKQGGTSVSPVAIAKNEINLSGTLVDQLPPATFGFAYFDLAHPAYKKYLQSPWGANKSSTFSLETLVSSGGDARSGLANVVSALKKAGLDLGDQQAVSTAFSKIVVFGVANAGLGEEPAIGGLLKANDGAALANQLSAVRTSFTQDGYAVADLSVKGGSGFSVESKPEPAAPGHSPAGPGKAYYGWLGDRAVVATNANLVTATLESPGSGLPLLTDPKFKKVTMGLPDDSSRYATWYFNFDPLRAALEKGASTSENSASKIFQAIGGSIAMKDVPAAEVRLAYDKEGEIATKILKGLSVGSPKEVVGAFTSAPMTFVSIDGALVQKIRQFLEESHKEDAAEVIVHLKALEGVSRIALGVRMAPVGTSILPIPDILLVAPSSNVDQTKKELVSLADSMVHLDKSEKTIGNSSVTVLRGPGVGVVIAATNNMVIASTSEPQLEKILQEGSKAVSFASAVHGRASQLLVDEPSVTNVYVDFKELGAFLENMGGMLSMYAPQSNEAKTMLDHENLERLKKLGSLSTAITLDDTSGLIRFESVYEGAS